MIIFKKIRYKNFLSTGNHFNEIDFQQNHTNLIIGTNGAGKSTMLDALTFGLFNKSFRQIKKSQLINATNEKDCVVEVEFSVNSRDYLVRRGIKPNLFDIEVNGNPLHKESDDRANQRILEESILKVNYKSFTKPYPVSYYDKKFKNSFGVVMDDVCAGLYVVGILVLYMVITS